MASEEPYARFRESDCTGREAAGLHQLRNTDYDNQFFLQMMSTQDVGAGRSPTSPQFSPARGGSCPIHAPYAPDNTTNPSEDFFDNQGQGPQFRAGTWQQVEMYFKINDDGRENGIFKLWINGVLVQSHNTVTMVNSAKNANMGLYDLHFDPIWGGNAGEIKSRNDAVYLDHVFVAGISQ